MIEDKDLIVIEKKLSFINLIIACLLIIYYVMMYKQADNVLEVVIGSILVIVFLVDYFFAYKNYFNNENYIKVTKYIAMCLLIIILFLIKDNNIFSTILYSLMYCGVGIEFAFTFDLTENYYKVWLVFFVIIPVIVVLCLIFIFDSLDNTNTFLALTSGMAFILFILKFMSSVSYIVTTLYNKINSITDIAIQNKEENENIKSYQDKIIQVNEQLSIKQFKLKEANEKITKTNHEISVQNKIIMSLTNNLELEQLIKTLNRTMVNDLGIDVSSICVMMNNANSMFEKYVALTDYSKESNLGKGNTSLMEDKKFVMSYIDNSAEILFSENANALLSFLEGTKIESLIIYPFIIDDETKGLIIMGKTKKKAFSKDDTIIQNIKSQITLGLSNSLLYSRMQLYATKDVLTGIYNRRYFNSIYNDMVSQTVADKQPMTVILFDIDKFKSINDTYGHIFGDEVISFCGHTALKYAEANDAFPVRYGGEEFVIIFPGKNTTEVNKIITKMHEEIKAHEFLFENRTIKINVSIGLASYPENCHEVNELLHAADTAMYYSKENGRGRITIYGN